MAEHLTVKTERNQGIDLLRVVSMLMIAMLHILGHGGVLKSLTRLSLSYEIIWFIEIACYCAVNCYALISGYVGCNGKFKYSNIAYIWLQVVFYSVLISTVAAKILPEVGIADVRDSFFPVANNSYWYFTSYFGMFFFIPLLNKIIEILNEKQLKITALTICVLFSVLPTLAKIDLFSTKKGYSAIWLGLLYMLGGIIRKCNVLQHVKKHILILMYFVVVTVTWAEKYVVEHHNLNSSGESTWKSILVSYVSPTVIFAAVLLLVSFSKLKVGKLMSKLIAFFSPLTFGVYLIHDNFYVRAYIVKDRFAFDSDNIFVLIASLFLSVICIFLVCSLIDYIRDRFFKLIRVKSFLVKIENKVAGKLWD